MTDIANELSVGDRVQITTCPVHHSEDETEYYPRDGAATDTAVVVDEDNSEYRSTEFGINGVKMVTRWEKVEDIGEDGEGVRMPINIPVAKITRISHANK